MSLYELAILGAPTAIERRALEATLAKEIAVFGFEVGRDVALHDATSLASRDPRAALAACFFVTPDADPAEIDAARQVVAAGAPIIPTVAAGVSFGSTPQPLAASNGFRRRADDPDEAELAAALLECVGLLRPQRRAFVSYRRAEGRAAALQLHDELSARGFEVFLDTHDIRPGAIFQEVLWHRLCDSDVMLMLDTPGYFDSRWTRQEIGRARAKDIQVLRVVWPAHTPTRLTDMSDTVYLADKDLTGGDGPLTAEMADHITLKVETLRSRSLASRHRSMAGKLTAEVERMGGAVEGIGAHRAISLRLLNGQRLWAYPVIGIPTAELLHDIVKRAGGAAHDGAPALVYDHVGLGPHWVEHLAWLEEKIHDVLWIKVTEAAWVLAGLDEGDD
jgi:hypothetical protein